MRGGGSSAREAPRKAPLWPGLGGFLMADPLSLAVPAPLGPVVAQWYAPCGLSSGGLYLHFGPQKSRGLNLGLGLRCTGPLLGTLPPPGSLGRGSAIPEARMRAKSPTPS